MVDTLRAIVFKDSDKYVAQCIEHDISAQADDLRTLIDRLELTVQAELEMRAEAGEDGLSKIAPAPAYYASLWDKEEVSNLTKLEISAQLPKMDLRLSWAA